MPGLTNIESVLFKNAQTFLYKRTTVGVGAIDFVGDGRFLTWPQSLLSNTTHLFASC